MALLSAAKLFQAIRGGDMKSLRTCLEGSSPDQIHTLLSSRHNETLMMRRPSTSKEIYVRKATPLVSAAIGWYPDILDYLAGFGNGLDNGCPVEDSSNIPAMYDDVTALVLAAISGKFKMVESLIKNGSNINKTTSIGDTPLLEACYEGHMQIVQHMIESGADMKIANDRGVTPLMMAAFSNNSEVVDYLLTNGADSSVRDKTGRNCLFYSISSGSIDTLKYLLIEGVKPNADPAGVTILMEACRMGNAEIAFYLVDNAKRFTIDINEKDKNGRNALYYCCDFGHVGLFDSLVKMGIPVEKAKEDRTLLMLAALKPNYNVVKYLLENDVKLGFDKNDLDSKGRNCLFYCATSGDIKLLQILVESGVQIYSSYDDVTILMQSSGKGQLEFTKYILENRVQLDLNVASQDKDGWNSLFYAVAGGHILVCRLLLANNIPVVTVKDGRTILMQAVARNDADMTRFILDNLMSLRLDINQKDHDGWNAAFYCAQVNNLEILKLLFKRGAKLMPATNGYSILMHAAERGLDDFAKYLVEHSKYLQLDLSHRDNMGSNVLFHIAKSGKLELLKFVIQMGVLVESNYQNQNILMLASKAGIDITVAYLLLNDIILGLDINQRDSLGRNAIFYAIDSENGSLPVTELLIGHGVGLLPDQEGRTPLMHACYHGRSKLVQYLLHHALELNIDTEACDKNGENALFCALKSKTNECLKLVLQHGIPSIPNKLGRTVVDICLEENLADRLQIILSKAEKLGDAVNKKDENGQTMLHQIVQRQQFQLLLHFSAHYDPARDEDANGYTALMLAVAKSDYRIIKHLIKCMKTDINAKDNSGRDALFHAVLANNFEAIQLLTECGANPSPDINGQTILMVAASVGNVRNVEYLLTQLPRVASSVNKKDNYGRTAAHFCAIHDNVEILNNLGARGCYLDEMDDEGMTPAMLASRQENCGFLLALLNKGIRVNRSDKKQRNALHHCCEGDDPKLLIIRRLTAEGIDVNARDAKGETALIKACRNGHTLAAKCLLNNNADPIVKDHQGNEAADYCQGKSKALKKILQKYSALSTHHRTLLEKYKADLVDYVDITRVIPRLHQDGILTTAQYVNTIEKHCNEDKTCYLLETLQYRGQRAFTAFCTALKSEAPLLAYEIMGAAYQRPAEVMV